MTRKLHEVSVIVFDGIVFNGLEAKDVMDLLPR